MLGRRLAESLIPTISGIQDSRRQRTLDAETQQRQTEQDEIQKLALMSALSEKGIVPGDQRERTMTPEVPTLAGMGHAPAPGMDVTGSRYSRVGSVGGQEMFRDKAQQIAQERAAERQARIEEALKLSQIGENQARAQSLANPAPKAPTPGTPEYFQMKEREAQIGAKYRQKPETAPRPADFEKKAAFLIEGAEEANKTLSTYRPSARSFVSKVPGLGNYGISEEEQTALQAAATLHDAYLRLTTGATISTSELDAAARQYVPQPGDKPDVIRAKAVRRAQIIRAIRAAAQPALAQQQRMGGSAGGSDVPYEEY